MVEERSQAREARAYPRRRRRNERGRPQDQDDRTEQEALPRPAKARCRHGPKLYPPIVSIENTDGQILEEVGMSDHFALKGTDLTGWPGTDGHCARSGWQCSVSHLRRSSLDITSEAAQECEKAESQQDQQKGQQKGKDKGKDTSNVNMPSVPLKSEDLVDTGEVAWYLDAQFPNIEVSVHAESTIIILTSTWCLTISLRSHSTPQSSYYNRSFIAHH
jgi:hypothetical protein